MIVDFVKEMLEIVKSYTPRFDFGYLERVVPILDISENGEVITTSLEYSQVYEIYPRAIALIDNYDEILERLESYSKEGIKISFYRINLKGRDKDYEKYLSLYTGIFKDEARMREHLFRNAVESRFYISFTSKTPNNNINLENFPFKIKRKLGPDEVFTLFRNIFRDKGKYSIEELTKTKIVSDYISIREMIFPSDIELLDDAVKIGEYYLFPIEIESISPSTPDKVLSVFQNEDAFYSVSFKYLSKSDVIEMIEKKIRSTKTFGFSDVAMYQRRILENLLNKIKLSDYKKPLCLYSMNILIFSKTKDGLKNEIEKTKSMLRSVGYSFYEVSDYMQSVARSLVGTSIAKEVVMMDDAISSLPAYVRFTGYKKPVVIFEDTKENGLIYFDPIDQESISWGIGIFGPTGMGKSNIANAIVKSLASLDSWITIMDIGDSYKEVCKFFDGEYIKIELDGRFTINPFQFRFGFDFVPAEHDIFLLKVIETLIRENFSPIQSSIIRRYINYLYKNFLNENNENWRKYIDIIHNKQYSPEIEKIAYQYFSKAMPTFEDFLNLYNQYIDTLSEEEKKEAKTIGIILKGLTTNKLFTGHTNFYFTNDFTVFELKSLQNYPEILEAFYMILQKFINDEVYYSTPDPETTPNSLIRFYTEQELLKRQKRYKVFLTDEFHFVKNSRQIVDDTAFMYRTGRKKNLIRIVISQFLTDLTIFGRDVFDGIVENMAVIFLAPHRGQTEAGDRVKAYEDALLKTAELLHLSPKELEEFQSLRRTGEYAEYYLVSRSKGRAGVRYRNSPLERWIYATYTKDTVIRDTLIRKYGRDTAYKLLLEKPREELEKMVEGGINNA